MILALSLAWADCPDRLTQPELREELTELETAYGDFDEPAFFGGMDGLMVRLVCLDGVVQPKLAARTHRAVALAVYAQDANRAAEALATAAALEPEARFPEAWFPSTHPLSVGLESPVEKTTRVPAPKEGAIWFDGVERERPEGGATLVQFTGADGAVVRSELLSASALLPEYERKPVIRRGLGLGAVGSAVVGGVLYGWAWAERGRFDDKSRETDQAALESMQGRINGLTAGSLGMGVVAVGSGVAALAVGPR